MFVFLRSDIQKGLTNLSKTSNGYFAGIPYSYLVLILNIITQWLCTSSVNKLSAVSVESLDPSTVWQPQDTDFVYACGRMYPQ